MVSVENLIAWPIDNLKGTKEESRAAALTVSVGAAVCIDLRALLNAAPNTPESAGGLIILRTL